MKTGGFIGLALLGAGIGAIYLLARNRSAMTAAQARAVAQRWYNTLDANEFDLVSAGPTIYTDKVPSALVGEASPQFQWYVQMNLQNKNGTPSIYTLRIDPTRQEVVTGYDGSINEVFA